jgi:hypothetical protein
MQKGIMILKNLCGMDYIGNIVDISPTEFIVENMFAVVPQQSQQTGDYTLALGSPIHPIVGAVNKSKHGCIDRVEVSRSTTVFRCQPDEELLESYRQAVSGIQLVKRMPGNM